MSECNFLELLSVIEMFVDGCSVKVPKGMTVLQACEIAGVDIPTTISSLSLEIAARASSFKPGIVPVMYLGHFHSQVFLIFFN